MSNKILDDVSDYWENISSADKVVVGVIVLTGMFFSYFAMHDWYYFHYPSNLMKAWEPEIVYPCRLLAGILTCFYGIAFFLEKIGEGTAIVLSILTLFGINLGVMFLW